MTKSIHFTSNIPQEDDEGEDVVLVALCDGEIAIMLSYPMQIEDK
jgi:hypothetical protein